MTSSPINNITRKRFIVFPVRKLIIVSLALTCSLGAQAKPSIEGVDLVSTTRFDRTKFDYKFALRVKGDTKHYDTGIFTATMNAPGSTLLNNKINTGRIDSGSFSRPAETITIRHDRTFPFDRSKLTFAFTGKLSASSIPSVGPTIGRVNFHEFGGRPGHEGSVPIRTENPIAGGSLALEATIFGNVNVAQYSLRDASGRILLTGNLPSLSPELFLFVSNIVIPTTKFSVEIKATGTDGKSNVWQSRLYTPQTFTARLEPATGVFVYGQTIPAKIVATSTTAAGDYTVSLLRPSDFAGEVGPWNLTISPGKTLEIPVQIITPMSGPHAAFFTLGVSYASKAKPQELHFSNLQFYAR